jgi:ATP-binding cassette subfamily G (WHITE) protein 2 (SNQ2)
MRKCCVFHTNRFLYTRDVFNGFLLGSLYYQLDDGQGCDAGCYTDRMSLLYYSMLLLVMGRMSLVAGLFQDRLVFYRERGSRAYGSLPYCLSVLLPRMPITALNVLCYSLFLYPMTGLRGGSHYCVFFVVLLLVGYCGLFLAYAVIAVSSSASVALSYFPAIMTFSMFYAGYVVYIPVMADWQRTWLPYLSMLRYAFQGLVLNEFQDNGDLPEAQEYINQLGFNVISIEGCCGALVIWNLLLVAVFCLAITYLNFEKR